MSPHQSSFEVPRARSATVLIVTPGGLEHGGGIGRQMGYFLAVEPSEPLPIRYRIVDTRGPWFIGSSRAYMISGATYAFKALVQLGLAGLSKHRLLIHANIAGRGSTLRKLVLMRVASAVGLQYILHLHDYDYAQYFKAQHPRRRHSIRNLFQRAAHVLVLGHRDRDRIAELMEVPQNRITVLHNAVPDPKPVEAKASRPGEQCKILFLGDLSKRKGVPELLAALAREPLRNTAWRLTLAGGGAVDKYKAQAEQLGLSSKMQFLGWVGEDRVKALCADADVVVLPSHAEGLAMSVLEGLSHGLAVVTTPVGAHLEVIENEITGLLVPPGDVAALSGALGRLVSDPQLRQRLGRAARQRFLDAFDVRKYSTKMRAIHAQLGAAPVASTRMARASYPGSEC